MRSRREAAAAPLRATVDEVMTIGKNAMTKKWVAFVSVLLLSGTAAVAASWGDNFKTLDTDGNGRISRTEWEANVSKLKLDPAPTFTAMDADVNNGVDEDEWTAGGKNGEGLPRVMQVRQGLLVSQAVLILAHYETTPKPGRQLPGFGRRVTAQSKSLQMQRGSKDCSYATGMGRHGV